MNWYGTGFSGVEDSVTHKVAERERLKKQPRRVMFKVGEVGNLIFLDDVAFTYDEHKIVPKGPDGWKNTVLRTCVGAARGCPDCAEGHKVNKMVAFSVIDRRKWIDKEGKPHENEKRLLTLRDDVALDLKRKVQIWGGLKGREVIVSRIGDMSPNHGNNFDVVRDASHQPVVRNLESGRAKGMDIQPYDYLDILAPVYKPNSTAAKPVSTGAASSPFGDADSDNPFGEAPAHVLPFGSAQAKPSEKAAANSDEEIPF